MMRFRFFITAIILLFVSTTAQPRFRYETSDEKKEYLPAFSSDTVRFSSIIMEDPRPKGDEGRLVMPKRARLYIEGTKFVIFVGYNSEHSALVFKLLEDAGKNRAGSMAALTFNKFRALCKAGEVYLERNRQNKLLVVEKKSILKNTGKYGAPKINHVEIEWGKRPNFGAIARYRPKMVNKGNEALKEDKNQHPEWFKAYDDFSNLYENEYSDNMDVYDEHDYYKKRIVRLFRELEMLKERHNYNRYH